MNPRRSQSTETGPAGRSAPGGNAAGRPPRVHLASLGCAKNLVDSEKLLAMLGEAGAVVGSPPEQADVIIVNTCGFIRPAKEESVDTILDLARHKRTGSCRTLLVMGCLGQRYAAELRAELPEVDGVFGLGAHRRIAKACGLTPGGPDDGRLLLTPSHTAYLRISEGCDNRCSYWAIPLIRGPFRSRPADEILAEARRLVASGVREICLIGQDTSLYGADRPEGPRIHELIERLSELPHLQWLRLLYTHPAHFSEQLIEAYASVEKLCPYVDLPLQHLNDTTLRRMGRKVTQARILRLIDRLRERVPGVVIRTAFIVGFPGETRAQFNEMRDLVRRIGFDQLGVFAYSQEEGTPAADMEGQMSERAKTRRRRDLMTVQQDVVRRKNAALRGQVCEAVIDEPSPTEQDTWLARTRAQAPDVDSVTLVSGPDLEPGRFLDVMITGHSGYDILARPV